MSVNAHAARASAPRVAIVGGGLAGLAVAFRLAERCEVVLIEHSGRAGGQIRTDFEHGCLVERGAESFVASAEALRALAIDAGLGDELVEQRSDRDLIWHEGRLAAIPPTSPLPARTSMRGGMQSLIDGLVARVSHRIDVRLDAAVCALAGGPGGPRLELSAGADLEADAVVLCTGAPVAAALCASVSTDDALTRAVPHSTVNVQLAYDRSDVAHPLDARGLYFAGDGRPDRAVACHFVTSRFVGRAPSETVLLRVFFRPSAADGFVDDAVWRARARDALGESLDLCARPRHVWTSSWPDALSRMADDDHVRLQVLQRELRESRVVLAGAHFEAGGDLGAAARSAQRAVDDVASMVR